MSNADEQAFPIPADEDHIRSRGLTKREYMATKLAAAIVAGCVARGCPRNEWPEATRDGARLADTLLAELAK